MPQAVAGPRSIARPRALTIAGWLFIAVGSAGLLTDWLPLLAAGAPQHLEALLAEGPAGLALLWGVRLLAVVGGAFLLRGASWARRTLVAWMLFHIGISLLHSVMQLLVHMAVFAGLTYVLFLPASSAYLQMKSEGAPRSRRKP